MKMGGDTLKWLFIITLTLVLHRVHSDSAVCDFSFTDNDKLINYSLASPLPNFPHGVLSEDGFYKVAVNETLLWFQLCNGMIFNHDPPRCVDCLDCGGPSRCGSECSALVGDNIGGYDICTTIGRVSRTNINIMDKKNPHKGVIVTMSSIGQKHNCSLSVSVICDRNGVQGPQPMEILGTCDYATMLWHPAGCATVVSVHGRGWGWFGTLITIILCLFGSYLLAGVVYRYFFLGVRGVNEYCQFALFIIFCWTLVLLALPLICKYYVYSIHVIPNLDIWTSLPHRTQSFYTYLVWRIRGPSQGHRSSYSRVNF